MKHIPKARPPLANLETAESGLGIALARLPLATAWLKQSKLVLLDRRAVASPLANYMVTAKQERRPEYLI